jgi:hypothetical protein
MIKTLANVTISLSICNRTSLAQRSRSMPYSDLQVTYYTDQETCAG